MMWRSIAMACSAITLLATSHSTAHSQLPNYTLVIETQLPNPASVRLASNIYTVSKKVQYLNINSTSGKSCKLRVNPLDENIQGRLQVKSLKDDKKLLVWGIRKTQGSSRYHTLLIVDAIACSYTPVWLPSEGGVRNDWPVFPAQIMVQERSRHFRVFYPQGYDCAPCTFDYNGKKREKGYPLESYRNEKARSHFWIDSYLRSDSYDKYFYAFNFADGTSTIHKMGIYYGTEETIHFNHTVDAASICQVTYQNTAICYKSVDKRRRVTCARLDAKLQPDLSWDLPLSGRHDVSDVSIEVDSIGNTCIGVLTTCRLHFFVYDVVGELAADLDFGTVDENFARREVKGFWFGRNYCLEAVVYSDTNVKDARQIVKCVDVLRYIED